MPAVQVGSETCLLPSCSCPTIEGYGSRLPQSPFPRPTAPRTRLKMQHSAVLPVSKDTVSPSPPALSPQMSRVELKYVIPARRSTPPQPPPPIAQLAPVSWADDIPDYGVERFPSCKKRRRHRTRRRPRHHSQGSEHPKSAPSAAPKPTPLVPAPIPIADVLTPQAYCDLQKSLGPAYRNCMVLLVMLPHPLARNGI